MFRSPMFLSPSKGLLIFVLCLVFSLPALGESPAVHPLLKPLAEKATKELTPILRSPVAGFNKNRLLEGREALGLHLRTSASRKDLEAIGLEVRTLSGGRATVTALPEHVEILAGRQDVSSITLPHRVWPSLETSIQDVGVEYLRGESGGTFSGATGSGVIIGVIDSGIDIRHPNFLDASGNSRILYLWDQNTGEICTSADIDAGTCQQQDDPSAFGHGTHVAGIAAGNGAAPDEDGSVFTRAGVAPEAGLIVVKTDWMTDGIVDGLHYIFDRADDLGLPAVANLSLGSHVGSHTGTSAMEETIDDLVSAQNGRAVVVAAGNERADDIHAEVFAKAGKSKVGPNFEILPYGGSAGGYVYMAGYYPDGDDLTVELTSPGGYSGSMALDTSLLGTCVTLDDDQDGYVYLCNNHRSLVGDSTPDNEILIVITDETGHPPAEGIWTITLTGNTVAGDGETDFWMTSNLGGSPTNAKFITHIDTSETVALPATSREAIAVGAHVTRTCWEDYTGATRSYSTSYPIGDLAFFSSAGPTRDGRAKPEVSAPGMGIVSALADEARNPIINSGYGSIVVNDHYLLMQGTSQAAPHVTGAVALLLQEDPTYSNADLKNLLQATAREDQYTRAYDEALPGPFVPFGLTINYSFGAGKLDLGPWGFNDPYETNDRLRQAFSIRSGEVLNGYIEHGDDVDLFHLDALEPGDTVEIDLTDLPDDYQLRLQRPLPSVSCGDLAAQNITSSDNAGTSDESITHPFGTASGRYIRVASSTGAFSTAQPYTLEAVLTRPEMSGVNGSTSTAQELPEFQKMKVAGTMSTDFDHDFYEFTAKGTSTILLSTTTRHVVRLYDSSGTELASGGGFLRYTPARGLFIDRTYYAEVSGDTGAYTLTLEQ